MFFKLLVLLSCLASLAGNSFAAPIASDVSLVARKPTLASAAAPSTVTPCSPTDQEAAAFGGATDADTNLISCSDLSANGFPCTNIADVATQQNLPLCSTADSPAAIASVAAAAAAASASAAAHPTPCSPTDQEAAAFGGATDADTDLISCSDLSANGFPCTNIADVATQQNLPLCSTADSPAAIASVAAAAAAASASAAAHPTACSPTDQEAAGFGGATDADTNLISCSDLSANGFPCTNIADVAAQQNLPLCSTAPGATR